MRGKLGGLFATVALVLAVSCSQAAAVTVPAGFTATTIASGLSGAVQVAWAPDGRMFVASATGGGNIWIFNPGANTPTVVHSMGGNIYGIGLDKDFAQNGYLYIVRTFGANTTQRLTRVTVKPDNTYVNPASPETVLLGHDTSNPCPPPSNSTDCIPAQSPHDLNEVISDPGDGTLWVSNGDQNNLGNPQTITDVYNEQSFAGKILHVDRNGNGLPGHPFCPSDNNLAHVCTKVWAKGFKNPYRFTLGDDGLPLVGDVGWRTREEISRARAGGDYGWPCYEGSIKTPGFMDNAGCAPEYAKEGTSSAAIGPLYDYGHTSLGAAIVAGPVYHGTSYPAGYSGNMFFGDYVNHWIKLAHFGAGGSIASVSDFATNASGLVDLEAAPNGNLVSVAGGVLTEYRYTGGANRPPTAVASADVTSGAAPLTVHFTGSGSSDPDGSALTYDWNFGDGSAHSTAANPAHTFAASSTARTVTLTVRDPQGATDSTTLTITPGNSAPVVTINAPATYRDGQSFTATGSATDAEDGALPVSALQWNTRLVHVDHTHDPENPSGVNHVDITTRVDHDADSHYEISLTATDSDGASTTKTVSVNPETRQLTLASSPSGAPVSYAGADFTAPYVHQSAIGFQTPISAAQTFSTGGHTYVFDNWSDGGTREHTLTVPAANTTITANYHLDDSAGGGGGGTPIAFEGETMKSPNTRARSLADATASAGKTEYYSSVVTASKTLTVPSSFDGITIRARGTQCNGAPNMQVLLDGGEVLSVPVTSTAYADYSASLVPRTAGSHTVAIRFTNDFAGGGCDRNLYVDKVTLAGSGSGGPPPPPPPPPPGSGTIEAESMTGFGSNVLAFSSTSASGGRAARFFRNATLTKTVSLPASSQVTMTAGGTQCQGPPVGSVKIDGTEVLGAGAATRAFADYTSPANITAGQHTVTLTFTNDFATSTCDRNLEVDKLTFSP